MDRTWWCWWWCLGQHGTGFVAPLSHEQTSRGGVVIVRVNGNGLHNKEPIATNTYNNVLM